MKRRIPRSTIIAELKFWSELNDEEMPEVEGVPTWILAVDLIDRGAAPDWYFQMACEDHEMPTINLVN